MARCVVRLSVVRLSITLYTVYCENGTSYREGAAMVPLRRALESFYCLSAIATSLMCSNLAAV